MSQKTVSYYLSEYLVNYLSARTDTEGGQNKSSQLELDLYNYYSLLDYGVKQVKRKLTKPQAMAVLDTMNNTFINPGDIAKWAGKAISGRTDCKYILTHELADSCDLDKIHHKWEIDRNHLLKTLDNLTPLEHVALVDWVGQMWNTCQDEKYWQKELNQFKQQEEETRQSGMVLYGVAQNPSPDEAVQAGYLHQDDAKKYKQLVAEMLQEKRISDEDAKSLATIQTSLEIFFS